MAIDVLTDVNAMPLARVDPGQPQAIRALDIHPRHCGLSDELDQAQREVRAFQQRVEFVKAQTGAPLLALRNVAWFCLSEAGASLPKNALWDLGVQMSVSLGSQPRDEHGTEFILYIASTAAYRGTVYQARGTVFGVALSHYRRTLVPDAGMQAAHTVSDVVDALIVVDPVHADWQFIERPVSSDPLLLGVMIHPYIGPPHTHEINAVFAQLCRW